VDHRALVLRHVGLVNEQANADAKQHDGSDADVQVLEGNLESGKIGHYRYSTNVGARECGIAKQRCLP
jgi:hypothetical protein